MTRIPPSPALRCLLLLLGIPVLATGLLPAAGQAQEGSAGAAVVGGLAGGVGGLLGFHGFTGCPVVTVGAAREADACDAGSLISALGGLGTGAWVGAGDSGAGYGMGVGAVAGFGLSLLLDQVADTPRWLDAALVVTGVVAGGLLGGEG